MNTTYSTSNLLARIDDLEHQLIEEQTLRLSAEKKILSFIEAIESHHDRPTNRTFLLIYYTIFCYHFDQTHTRKSLAHASGYSQRTIARSLAEYPELSDILEPAISTLLTEGAPSETPLQSQPEPAKTTSSPVPELSRTKLSPTPELAKTTLSYQPAEQWTTLSSAASTSDNLVPQPRTKLSPPSRHDDRFVPQPPMTTLSRHQNNSNSNINNNNNLDTTNRLNNSNSNINNNYSNMCRTIRPNESSYTNSAQKLNKTIRQNESSHLRELEENQKRIVQPETAETTLSPHKRVRTGLPFKGAVPSDIYRRIIDYSRLMSDHGKDAERINVARIRAYYQTAVPTQLTHTQFYALMQEAREKAAQCPCCSIKQLPNGHTTIARMKLFWTIFESLIGFQIRKGHITQQHPASLHPPIEHMLC